MKHRKILSSTDSSDPEICDWQAELGKDNFLIWLYGVEPHAIVNLGTSKTYTHRLFFGYRYEKHIKHPRWLNEA